MKPRIYLSSPHMGGTEQDFVKQAFDTNWIAPLGPLVDGFEHDLATFTGMKHAAVLSSGTAALHLALIILGVQTGDEVICSSFTFSASANPIVYLGATPVFVDCEKDTWNIDPEALETAIMDRVAKGKKPKAAIIVHLYGMPAKMREIMAILDRFEIPLIEDAAEALGSTYEGRPLGSFGVLGVLSFNGNKIITTSGGGALLSNDETMINQARFLATQARDPAPHYQHSHIGYNYRLSNVCAGIGRGQMQVLPDRVAARRAVFERYERFFKNIPGITPAPLEPPGMFSNRWLSTVLIDSDQIGMDREAVRQALEKDNIESRPLWKPLHLQPIFADAPYYGDRTSEKLFDQGLCLASCSNLTNADFERIENMWEQVLKTPVATN
jgi:dTDP-4-amino-4,6-dideoxygalactose transaminase